jgi:hypothetical protein
MDIDPETAKALGFPKPAYTMTDDPRYSGGHLARHGLPKDR